jgi:hypothetical protein
VVLEKVLGVLREWQGPQWDVSYRQSQEKVLQQREACRTKAKLKEMNDYRL